MKIFGERILGSNLRFVFEVEGDELTTADKMHIERMNDVVADNLGGDASLADVVDCLKPLVESEGEVRVSIEAACEADGEDAE